MLIYLPLWRAASFSLDRLFRLAARFFFAFGFIRLRSFSWHARYQFFSKIIIQLPLSHVGGQHTDHYFIAYTEFAACTQAYQRILAFIMFEFIFGHQVVHAHQAFTFGGDGLYPEAEMRNTAHYALKGLADELLHVFHLLVFVGSSFCIHGLPFHLRAVLALLLHMLVRLDIVGQALRQHPVYQHIGITAYRRSEMAVMLKAQAVVPDVIRGVNGLGHGTD